MADKKISQLTALAKADVAALADVLPIVDASAGVNKKITVLDLVLAALAQANGNIDVAYNTLLKSGAALYIYNATNDGLGIWYNPGGAGVNELVARINGADRLTLDGATGDVTNNTGNFKQGTAGKGFNFIANSAAAGMTSQLLNWYEEGTFTATLTGGSAAPTSPPTVSARYTRVGRQVTVQLNFSNVNTTGGSGTLLVTGLPFTNSAQGAFGSCFFIGNGTAAGVAYVQPSSSQIAFLEAATGAYINMVAGTGKYLGLTVTYTV